MRLNLRHAWVTLAILSPVIFALACSLTSNPGLTPTPTPTATITVPLLLTPTSELESRCKNLSGTLEMQVLVGPAETAGMEPFAVGEIPFSVQDEGGIYTVQGGGPISYQEVLEEAWGTYTVSLDMDTTISGQCAGDAGSEQLHMNIEMSGDQLLEVRADGFSGDYPWSGTTLISLDFPMEEGNMQSGEGWAFLLHLNN